MLCQQLGGDRKCYYAGLFRGDAGNANGADKLLYLYCLQAILLKTFDKAALFGF